MATKPTETFEWSTATNHATGPQAGNATKVDPPGHPANTTGFTPGTGIIPEYVNKLLNILGKWTGWLGSGSSAGAADAHLVETDANGDTEVQKLTGTELTATEQQKLAVSGVGTVNRWAARVSNVTGSPVVLIAAGRVAASGERISYDLVAHSDNGDFDRQTALVDDDTTSTSIADAGTPISAAFPFGTVLNPRLGNLSGSSFDILVTVPANSSVTVFISEFRSTF